MLKVRKYIWKDKVYGYQDCNFGDMWAVTNYLLRMSQEIGKPARFFTKSNRFKNAIRLIRPHLKSPGSIQVVPQPPQIMLNYCQPFSIKFLRTHKVWQYQPHSKIVAYQFDGNHLSNLKNLHGKRLSYLLKSLKKMGYQPVDVGHYKPLPFIIEILSKCRFFVGCPSGLSIISISVGNPVYLITRRIDPKYCNFMKSCQYRHKNVQMYRTVDEFLIQVKRMSQIGKML